MKQTFLEAGQIVNTHGIRGEIKIDPWCDSAEFLCGFSKLYIDGKAYEVRSAHPHKGMVLAALDHVSNINEAMLLKGKVVSIDRTDAALPEGRHFIADLIGLEARESATGQVLGKVVDVLSLPAQEVYVIRGAEHQYMIPAVAEYLVETNIEGGYIRVKIIEGMAVDVPD